MAQKELKAAKIGKIAAVLGMAALAAAFLLCCLVGVLTECGVFPAGWTRGISGMILFLTVFCGCILSVKIVGEKRMIVALLTAGVYLLGVLVIALAAFPDAFPGILGSVVVGAAAAISAGLVGSRRKKHRKY